MLPLPNRDRRVGVLQSSSIVHGLRLIDGAAYVHLIADWLRGLFSSVSLARAEALGQEIAARLEAGDAALADGIRDEAALMLAIQVMDGIGLRWG